ncbi:hypothetical protein JTE90_002776, partial [Oedothorax gibbosus]
AHSEARFAILNVLLDTGEDFVKLEETTGEDGETRSFVSVDKNKIVSVGKPAIAKFPGRIQRNYYGKKETQKIFCTTQYSIGGIPINVSSLNDTCISSCATKVSDDVTDRCYQLAKNSARPSIGNCNYNFIMCYYLNGLLVWCLFFSGGVFSVVMIIGAFC